VTPGTGDILWSHGDLPYPDRDPLLLPEGRIFVPFQEYGAMLQVAGDGAPRDVRELWRSEFLKNSYSPAVHHEGAVYGAGSGYLACLSAAGGETLWKRRFGDISLIRVDDHLVVFGSMSGRLHLVPASPAGYTEAATLSVFSGGHSLTPPSFAAGRIFLRGAREIAAVRVGQ